MQYSFNANVVRPLRKSHKLTWSFHLPLITVLVYTLCCMI